ncbi:ribonuclease T [Candidatus Curculioniphilus buchneri]|uniref:ribonuclease T n=1 Tax=Candidatus Curculioniphilus buchneri TaxID=690594 RepID=UPI00376F44CF
MVVKNNVNTLCARFRGFYPVVVDVETAGLNSSSDALLEIGVITMKMDSNGWLEFDNTLHFHIDPFPGSLLQPEALAFNGIDPCNPLRGAISEYEAIHEIFKLVRKGLKEQDCSRAIIVAHNAAFDHGFLMAAASRSRLKRNPFHPFVTFDTATLSGLVLGQTVLAKACKIAGVPFNSNEAHSALYDTGRTASLFCELVNRWKRLGGWPPQIILSESSNALNKHIII